MERIHFRFPECCKAQRYRRLHERSLLILIKPHCLLGCAVASAFLCGRFSLLPETSGSGCECLIELEITPARCLLFLRVALGSVRCLSSTVTVFIK